jgi:hypothetical protein
MLFGPKLGEGLNQQVSPAPEQALSMPSLYNNEPNRTPMTQAEVMAKFGQTRVGHVDMSLETISKKA